MNRLFVHNPWFRLFGPLFSGTLVYLLLLLINDSVLSINEDFLSQELFVCIALAYLSQEFLRLSLLIFGRFDLENRPFLRVVLQLMVSLILTVVLVTGAVYLYFSKVLFYEPNFRELLIFNSIFSFITLLYVVLYFGHYFLYRRNTSKIKREELALNEVDHAFNHYVKGINPSLLFESLEAMLVEMKSNPDRAEELSDRFSEVYRYMLSKRKQEVVTINEEMTVAKHLIRLFNHLPYRKVELENLVKSGFQVLPTTILVLIQNIVRSTIVSEKQKLSIKFDEVGEMLTISYKPEEKLQLSFNQYSIKDLSKSYSYYTEKPISIHMDGTMRIIALPKLNLDERSNN
ncbi:histidine kinase [Croceivirga thetidis]|uniref:Histidine kinase n=1 Tax=Croceivirga thetidis TaxID=2721623 RepID=A0ABX1GQY0_9FLAO|nr:histidine kinase [Croceivirga thetidis]NKI32326.1 histidine kinase [Croceivirga thetidis]